MNASIPDYCQVLQVKGSDGTVKELYFPKALDLHRPKRPRTTFSSEQLTVLEHKFEKSSYLVGKERRRLAERLQLSEIQIKVWFQNRRTKKRLVANEIEFYDERDSRSLINSKRSNDTSFQALQTPQMNTMTASTTTATDLYKWPAIINELTYNPSDWLKMVTMPGPLTTDVNPWKFTII